MWTSTDGAGIKVKVVDTDPEGEGWVKYQWEERCKTVTHEKSAWCFQVRYEPVDCDIPTVLSKLEAMSLLPNADVFWLQQAKLKLMLYLD